jgi:hypothetical protein
LLLCSTRATRSGARDHLASALQPAASKGRRLKNVGGHHTDANIFSLTHSSRHSSRRGFCSDASGATASDTASQTSRKLRARSATCFCDGLRRATTSAASYSLRAGLCRKLASHALRSSSQGALCTACQGGLTASTHCAFADRADHALGGRLWLRHAKVGQRALDLLTQRLRLCPEQIVLHRSNRVIGKANKASGALRRSAPSQPELALQIGGLALRLLSLNFGRRLGNCSSKRDWV